LRIEAGVLARRTAREIAADEDLPVEIIEAYEALFFDIRSKLNASSYIRWTAIGRDSRTGEIGSWPAFVRQMAYDRGPLVLDAAFMSALPIPPETEADPLRLRLRRLWLVMSTPASALSPVLWKELERLASTRLGPGTGNQVVDPAAKLASLVARSPAAKLDAGVEKDPENAAETTHQERQVG
jgi:hypothetical protein